MIGRLRSYLNTNGLSFPGLIVRTVNHVLTEHGIFTRASAIAFAAMMAFVPFLMLVMTIAVRLLPNVADGGTGAGLVSIEQLEAALNSVFPQDVARIVLDQIARIQDLPSLPVISLTIALSIWTASALFLEIIDALNRIHGVVDHRPWWQLRLTAIVMTMIQSLLLFGSLVVIVAWPQILHLLGLKDAQATTATLAQWMIMFMLMLLSFGLTFHVGPAAMQSRKWVTPGAIFGTIVFLLASYLFRIYVQCLADYTTAYGPLGGVMMLLFWFWISGLVLLMAAEMNKLAELASDVGANGPPEQEAQIAKVSSSTGGRPPNSLATDARAGQVLLPAVYQLSQLQAQLALRLRLDLETLHRTAECFHRLRSCATSAGENPVVAQGEPGTDIVPAADGQVLLAGVILSGIPSLCLAAAACGAHQVGVLELDGTSFSRKDPPEPNQLSGHEMLVFAACEEAGLKPFIRSCRRCDPKGSTAAPAGPDRQVRYEIALEF